MQFKDAAYEILKRAGKPLHYNEITDKAIAANLLETSGKTPHASMGALLYTDALNPDSRFRRGDQKGTFALKVAPLPGIETNPQVCGGEPCIVRTRIPVWVLVQARRLGTSEAKLLFAYPTLRAEDLANAWAYERSHRKEIDAQIHSNEAA